ncbi:MAG TPA: hypothetical protein VLU23_15755 [Pseudolabrys sp.]|jgi:RimJ/RimL family protein N-acetyltransferase|nr:hypothetical protein [Pseudolabrys sp.]
MTISKDYLTERELRYRVRPDANRFLRPDWRRFWRPGYENDPFYRFFERLERRYRPDQLRDDQGRFAFEGEEQVSIGLEAGNKIRLLKVFRQASE